MLFLGCDPDLHTTAFAVVDENMRLQQEEGCLKIVKVHEKLTGPDAVKEMVVILGAMTPAWPIGSFAVEAQQIIPSGKNRTRRPQDIVLLGHVAGAALGMRVVPSSVIRYFPLPVQWKGSVCKIIHHRRILNRAGYSDAQIFQVGKVTDKYDGYCGLVGSSFNKGDWKHLTDAIGLAQWAADQYLNEQRKAKYLKVAANQKAYDQDGNLVDFLTGKPVVD